MVKVFFQGPVGVIEGEYFKSKFEEAPSALILHPHPKCGGTMNNRVVYHVYREFARNGFNVLRINFRGVGRSAGSYGGGIGELNDATSAIDWLQSQNSAHSSAYWVAGFSFGAWISMQLLIRRPEIRHFISASLPVGIHDFSFLSLCPTPGLVIHGAEDSLVGEFEVANIIKSLNSRNSNIEYSVIEKAKHMFSDEIPELTSIIDSYIKRSFIKENDLQKTDSLRKKRRVVYN